MAYCFQTDNLSKSYGSFCALDGLTMHVPEGSIYGFVGKNGAGKTTLIRLLCGLQAPTAGTFSLFGVQSGEKTQQNTHGSVGAVVETPSLYLHMTAAQNLRQQYLLLGKKTTEGIEELLQTVGLADTGKKKVKDFSLGMRQRLGIALALAGNPRFLVLDEPVNGLDPQGIVEVRELLQKLNRERGITILISSHILDELSRLATCYGFIDKGKMVREISADELSSLCKKSVQIKVTDIHILACVLDDLSVAYSLGDSGEAEIFGETQITPLVTRLAELGCSVLALQEKDESLESFYMELLGGESK